MLLADLCLQYYILFNEQKYLDEINNIFAWIKNTELINDKNLINDGINLNTCKNNYEQIFSYNQCIIPYVMIKIGILQNNSELIVKGKNIIDASLKFFVNENNIFNEGDMINEDRKTFKGIYFKYLMYIYDLLDINDVLKKKIKEIVNNTYNSVKQIFFDNNSKIGSNWIIFTDDV